MLNLSIQVLTLFCGLLVNFLIPAVYGLAEYGLFLQANILVFLFHKLTDIACEPLLSHVDARYMLPMSASIGAFVLGVFSLIDFFYSIGDPLLLAAMLLSSSVLVSMYALRYQRHILSYLVAFLSIFFLMLGVRRWSGLSIDIEGVLLWTNAIPAFGAVLMLIGSGISFPPGKKWFFALVDLFKSMPHLLATTLVFNLLTNILPFVLSKTLPVRDLGLFRVVASVIQSATSLFPVNTKAIFSAFVLGGVRGRQYRLLMGISLLYFSGLGFSAFILAWMNPQFSSYVALVGSLPVLYWAVLLERYLLAQGRRRQVIVANLAAGLPAVISICFIADVGQAVLLFAGTLSFYFVVLQGLGEDHGEIGAISTIWVVLLSPFVAWGLDTQPAYGAVYLAISAFIAVVVFRLRVGDLHAFKGEL